jgi:hypothetical protein
LRASDLTPSSLQRDFSNAKATGVRYYESLRVVYELESRVHDLQTAQESDQSSNQPTGQPAPNAQQPDGQAPSTPANEKAAPQPDTNQPNSNHPESIQPEQKKPAPSPGSSRREDLDRGQRLFLADARVSMSPVRGKRTLV